jgi:tetratricopeptide (TPR) repeat protein
LYAQDGRTDEAVAAMQTAAERAPGAASYQLNLGVLLEAAGREAEAQAHYLRALDLNPSQAESSFWTQTPLRETAREAWRVDNPHTTAWLTPIETLIDAGKLDAAEREVLAAWRQNDQSLSVYRGLARLARARGDLELARRYIECALWVQTVNVDEQALAMLDAADIAYEGGEPDVALARYHIVLDAVTDFGAYGWGSGAVGWTPYAFFVFQRRGVGEELLPQLARADFTMELGQRLLTLAALHEQRGERAEAAEVYRRLLAADPALDEARQRLTALGLP